MEVTQQRTPQQEQTPTTQPGQSQGSATEQAAGNQAAQQSLPGQGTASGGEGEQCVDPEAEALEQFRAHGPFGPQDIVAPLSGIPGQAGLGGFSARFDPIAELLTISLETTFNFVDGLSMSGGACVAPPEAPNLANVATVINNTYATEAERQNIVSTHFTWSDETSWSDRFESVVEQGWSFNHPIGNSRPYWDELSVEVDFDVVVLGSGGGGHCAITVVKVPEPSELHLLGQAPEHGPRPEVAIQQGGSVHSGGSTNITEDTDARNNRMTLSSTHLDPRSSSLLRLSVYFAQNRSDLSADAVNTLRTAVNRYQDAGGDNPPPIDLVGHASSEGRTSVNRRLAQQRIDSVRNWLQSNGLTNFATRVSEENQGEEGADATNAWRRVDIECDNAESQVVALHEVGHAVGLGDRYTNQGITGTGQATGTQAAHGGMAQAAGEVAPVHENNADIMSLGNRISASSYAPFVHALGAVTGEAGWHIA